MFKALVADDNPLTLEFFAEALASMGIEVVRASNGIEAWQRAREARCDLLLLDDHMPGLNGSMALTRIRAGDGPSSAALALATTAANDTRTRNRLLAAGFADVLDKPVTVQALRTLLGRHIELPDDRPSEHSTAAATAKSVYSMPADPALPSIPDASPVTEPALGVAEDAPTPTHFDDTSALASVGGDPATLRVLRGLLAMELDALPAEIDELHATHDIDGLLDRLHRLQASAGFCGTPGLMTAATRLRGELARANVWDDAAVGQFMEHCRAVHKALQALSVAGATPTT